MLGRYLSEKMGSQWKSWIAVMIPLHDSLQAMLRMDFVQDAVSSTADVQSFHVTGVYTVHVIVGDEFTSIKQWIARGLL